jgi:C4-dicarboxylate-specific signal transduction histidine kinase
VLTVDVAPGLADVLGDRIQMETVLHNLIANAIDALKEVPGERRIELAAAHHDADHVRLSVTDNGPGLATSAREALFRPFATAKAEGLGLGLAISRSIVEAHGGALWLADSATGTSFCLTLPVARTG